MLLVTHDGAPGSLLHTIHTAWTPIDTSCNVVAALFLRIVELVMIIADYDQARCTGPDAIPWRAFLGTFDLLAFLVHMSFITHHRKCYSTHPVQVSFLDLPPSARFCSSGAHHREHRIFCTMDDYAPLPVLSEQDIQNTLSVRYRELKESSSGMFC